jgi:Fe(3+) dicitrate transport protein
MQTLRQTLIITAAILCFTATTGYAANTPPTSAVTIDETPEERAQTRITITGGKQKTLKSLPGSAYLVDSKTLQNGTFTDPQRALREVPGLSYVEEEGFGNKPNIGIRASRTDRSADITLMEDGVLIAPAPYSSPGAYYFPRIERMESVEVRKGSSAIQFGPRTTNGAINFVSSTIPSEFSGKVIGGIGSYDSTRAQLNIGDDSKHFGYVIDALNTQSDGFKRIDGIGGDTGFNMSEFMGKLRLKTDATLPMYQEVEAKFGRSYEDSNQTYLGLTQADFNANPYRQYAASQLDGFKADLQHYQLRHYIEPLAGLDVSTTAYYRTLDRDWDKLENIRFGTGPNRSLSSVLDNPATFANELAILRGGNSANDALTYRDNDRTMMSKGVQTDINYKYALVGLENTLQAGVRLHHDSEDRFQTDQGYRMENGRMIQTSQRNPGSQTNRIASADAWSGYVLNKITYGDLSFTPGVRYENVQLETRDFGNSDPNRTGNNVRIFENDVQQFMPGIGATYQINPEWMLLAGVHKGFAPPAPPTSTTAANSTDPEESVNYEAGFRYSNKGVQAEVVGFLTNYDNLLGTDSTSAGAGTGDQFNGGKVTAYGLESSLHANVAEFVGIHSIRLPVKLSYSFTHSEFESSFNSSFAEWGNVRKGDEIPYIARHQFFASAGVEDDLWLINVSGKYTGKMRTIAGQGAYLENASTDGSFVVDINAEYEFYGNTRAYLAVNNLFDEVYIASRRPSGLRPGAPRIVWAGLKYAF